MRSKLITYRWTSLTVCLSVYICVSLYIYICAEIKLRLKLT